MNTVKAALLSAAALYIVGASGSADAHGARSHGARAHVGIHVGAPVVSHRTHVVVPRKHFGVPHRHFGVPRTHFAVPHAHIVAPRTHVIAPRAFVGVHLGVPLVVPHVYYYPSPPLIAEAPVYAPPAYVERHAPAHDATAYWHYCPDSQAYYPYVQQCASPWERVIPHAPPPPAPAD